MKIFMGCIKAAALEKEMDGSKIIEKLTLDEYMILIRAAEIYCEPSNSHKHGVVRPAMESVSEGEQLATEAMATLAEGQGESTIFIDGDFNDSYEARVQRSKGRARFRPKGKRVQGGG